MKARFIVSGHSLLNPQIVKDLMPGVYKPHRAVCSCGAWSDVIAMPNATARAKAQRNWHDEHKIEVLRKQGKLEEE
jgi:hypothetical protein